MGESAEPRRRGLKMMKKIVFFFSRSLCPRILLSFFLFIFLYLFIYLFSSFLLRSVLFFFCLCICPFSSFCSSFSFFVSGIFLIYAGRCGDICRDVHSSRHIGKPSFLSGLDAKEEKMKKTRERSPRVLFKGLIGPRPMCVFSDRERETSSAYLESLSGRGRERERSSWLLFP